VNHSTSQEEIEKWNGDGHPKILPSRNTAEEGAGFQVRTGARQRLYAVDGIACDHADWVNAGFREE